MARESDSFDNVIALLIARRNKEDLPPDMCSPGAMMFIIENFRLISLNH